MGYFVYMLKCADGSLYTGIAQNLEKRLGEHQAGKGSKYVRSKQSFALVYQEFHESKSAALKREHFIKKLTRLQKIKLISQSQPNEQSSNH